MKYDATHYEVLGIKEEATLDEIKAARRKLLLENHADKQTPGQTSDVSISIDSIQAAYNTLNDATARKEYDTKLHKLRNWQKFPEVFEEVVELAFTSQNLDNLREIKNYLDVRGEGFSPQAAVDAMQKQQVITLRWLLTEGGVDIRRALATLTLNAVDSNFIAGFEIILELADINHLTQIVAELEYDPDEILIGDKISDSAVELSLIKYIVKSNNIAMLKALVNKDRNLFNLDTEVFPDLYSSNAFSLPFFYGPKNLPLVFYPLIAGNMDLLQAFKDLGMNVNVADYKQRNALLFMLTTFNISTERLKTLLDLGLDMNQKMARGHFASSAHIPMAFNETQRHINHVLAQHFCAFNYAVYSNHYAALKLFLDEEYLDKLNINILNQAISLAGVLVNHNASSAEANKAAVSLKLMNEYRNKHYRFDLFGLQYDRRMINGAPVNISRAKQIRYAITDAVQMIGTTLLYFVPTFFLFAFSLDIPALAPLLPMASSISALAAVNDIFALNLPTRFSNVVQGAFNGFRSYFKPKATPSAPANDGQQPTPVQEPIAASVPANDSTFLRFSPYKMAASLRDSAQASFDSVSKSATENATYYGAKFGLWQ